MGSLVEGGTVIPFPARPPVAEGRPGWADAVARELETVLDGVVPVARGTPATASSYMARLLAAGRADAVAAGPGHADVHLAVARAMAAGTGMGAYAHAVAAVVAAATAASRAATREIMRTKGGRPGRELPGYGAWVDATRAEFAAAAMWACVRGDPAGATMATLLAAARLSGGDRGAVRDRAVALWMALGREAP